MHTHVFCLSLRFVLGIWRVSQSAKCFSCKHEDMGLITSTYVRVRTTAHTDKLSSTVEPERSRVLWITGEPVWTNP